MFMKISYLILGVALLIVVVRSLPNPCLEACGPGTKCYNTKCVPVDQLPVSCTLDGDCLTTEKCLGGICVKNTPAKSCVPACNLGQTCTDGNCTIKLCNKLCLAGQHCVYGQCVPFDDCAEMTCPTGTICRYGNCVQIPVKPCTKPCFLGAHCVNNECVPIYSIGKCAAVLCPADSTCKDGICIPIPVKVCTKFCIKGTRCVNNQCVPIDSIDKCAAVLCPADSTCKDGVCIPNSIKACTKFCGKGTRCVKGECVPIVPIDKCARVVCKPDQICYNGLCSPALKACKGDQDCKIGQKCNKVGVCQDKCKRVQCPWGKICIQGRCENKKCGKVDCPAGTSCKNNVCVPDIAVCPADAAYQAKVCTNPRPNEVTCPTIYYFRAPDPLFCGVRADGTRVNFAEQCTTCKDKSIVYYFTKPCHLAPFVCQSGEECNGYYCSSSCQNNEDCPYDWQFCNQNKCVDKCALAKCSQGPCQFGQCAYEEASGSCTLGPVSGCKKDNWSCVGFECADLCVRQACPPNHTCNQGNCQPNA